MSAFHLLVEYRTAFFGGALVTLQLFSLALIIGTFTGVLLYIVASTGPRLTMITLNAVSFITTSIPALIILFWLHYPLQAMLDVIIPPFRTAVTTLVIINTFGVFRVIRDAREAYPSHYTSAALVCGMHRLSILRHIEIPILMRLALPRWIDQQAVVLQSTIFASIISVNEVFRVAQRINSQVYKPIEIYTAMALVFLATAGPLLLLSTRLRRGVSRDLSER